MSNKEVLSEFESIAPKYAIAYKNGNIEEVTALNIDFLAVCDRLDKIPNNKKDNLEHHRLTHTLGNSKIGTDTICINVSAGLNCPMNLLGNCGNCSICYAVSQNKRYFKNTVPKNLINQTIINQVVTGQISLHNVLFELVQDIYCSYTDSELSELKYLRLNVEGDILNNDILTVCDKIAETLINVFGLVSAYSYTHNKELNLTIAENIVFNCSDFENEHYNKSCYTFLEYSPKLEELALTEKVKLCLGDCGKCSYCKDKDCTVPIVFLAHGGDFLGVEAIPEPVFEELELIRDIDNNIFLVYAGV